MTSFGVEIWLNFLVKVAIEYQAAQKVTYEGSSTLRDQRIVDWVILESIAQIN